MTAASLPQRPALRVGRYQIRHRDHSMVEDLRRDIKNRGITQPLIVDQDYYIVDGHHRYQIARELGFQPDEIPIVQITYANLDAALAEAVWLNHLRDSLSAAEADRLIQDMASATKLTVADLTPKPMTVEERREAVIQMRARGMSTRAIASELGIGEGTVRNDLSTAQDCAVDLPDTVTGLDGKKRKARKDPQPETPGAPDRWGRDDETDERRRLVLRFIEEGVSSSRIARRHNINPSVVANDCRWLRDHGLLPEPTPVAQQIDRIADLAQKGHTSRQIAEVLNVGFSHIRNLCSANDIDVPADRIVRGKPEANAAMTNTTQMLEEVVESFARISIASLDPALAEGWLCSLGESAKQISALRKRINQLPKEQNL